MELFERGGFSADEKTQMPTAGTADRETVRLCFHLKSKTTIGLTSNTLVPLEATTTKATLYKPSEFDLAVRGHVCCF